MLSFLFVILCLIAPFLIMWRLFAVQRRVREMSRGKGSASTFEVPYVDEIRSSDGLSYSRQFDVNDELIAATREGEERSGFKDLNGRR